jgi:hypothetical protein
MIVEVAGVTAEIADIARHRRDLWCALRAIFFCTDKSVCATPASGQHAGEHVMQAFAFFGPRGKGPLVDELAVLGEEIDHQCGRQQLKSAHDLVGREARGQGETPGGGRRHELAQLGHDFRSFEVAADKALQLVHERDPGGVVQLCCHQGLISTLPRRHTAGEGWGNGLRKRVSDRKVMRELERN